MIFFKKSALKYEFLILDTRFKKILCDFVRKIFRLRRLSSN